MTTPLDPRTLTRDLIAARDSLNNAIACASQGDLFGAGSHYRASLESLIEIGSGD